MNNIALATAFSVCFTNPVFANTTTQEVTQLVKNILDFTNEYEVAFSTWRLSEQSNTNISQNMSFETQVWRIPMRLSYSHDTATSQATWDKTFEYDDYDIWSISAIWILSYDVEKLHVETELFWWNFWNIWVWWGISKYDLVIDAGIQWVYGNQHVNKVMSMRKDDVYNVFLTSQFDQTFQISDSWWINLLWNFRYEPGNSEWKLSVWYEYFIWDSFSLSAEVLYVCCEYHELLNAFNFHDWCQPETSIWVWSQQLFINDVWEASFKAYYSPTSWSIRMEWWIRF